VPTVIAILEDDPRRIAAMRSVLGDLLPHHEPLFFDSAPEMIRWLATRLPEVALISLDHDLPLPTRDAPDPGTGRHVADYLSAFPHACPVIIHSSNDHFAPGIYFQLHDAGWPCSRVHPCDDLAWIPTAWADRIRDFMHRGWLPSS
jgi:hypothetical protein